MVREIEDDMNVVSLGSDALPDVPSSSAGPPPSLPSPSSPPLPSPSAPGSLTDAGPSEAELSMLIGQHKVDELKKLLDSLFRGEVSLDLSVRTLPTA